MHSYTHTSTCTRTRQRIHSGVRLSGRSHVSFNSEMAARFSAICELAAAACDDTTPREGVTCQVGCADRGQRLTNSSDLGRLDDCLRLLDSRAPGSPRGSDLQTLQETPEHRRDSPPDPRRQAAPPHPRGCVRAPACGRDSRAELKPFGGPGCALDPSFRKPTGRQACLGGVSSS
jgi:hypothetical protein